MQINDLSGYLKRQFGCKVYKLSLVGHWSPRSSELGPNPHYLRPPLPSTERFTMLLARLNKTITRAATEHSRHEEHIMCL